LDGSHVNEDFIPNITPNANPGAIAVDNTYIYWADYSGYIGRAKLDGSSVDPTFMADPAGPLAPPVAVAVDGAHLYWTQSYDPSAPQYAIGRANLDGSAPDPAFITVGSYPSSVAVDGAYIYWTNAPGNSIGRAKLDGSAINENFITGASSPDGITVDGGRGPVTSPISSTAECHDLATLSPSLGHKFEKTLWPLPHFVSKDLPLAVNVSLQPGGLGICQTGIDSLATGLGSASLPELLLQAKFQGGSPQFTFQSEPLGWTIPPDTGAPAQQLTPQFDFARAEVSARPQLDFTYAAGQPFDVNLSVLRIGAYPLTVTLIDRGSAFLDATLGPQLSFGLGLDKQALAKRITDKVQEGEDPKTAADEVAQQADREIPAAMQKEFRAIDPIDVQARTFVEDMSRIATEIEASLEAQLASEASLFADTVAESVVGSEGVDAVLPAAEDSGGLRFLLILFEFASDHQATTSRLHVFQTAITPTAANRLPRTAMLAATHVGHISPRSLRRSPFPRSAVSSLIPQTFTLTTRTVLGPLAVTQTHLRGGLRITVIAPGLRRGRRHAAELVVAGPGYRASRLLAVSPRGGAGATFKLPRRLAAGLWVIAVEDISGVTSARRHVLRGVTIIRAGVFDVAAKRHSSKG
jgi:hypothetical protein